MPETAESPTLRSISQKTRRRARCTHTRSHFEDENDENGPLLPVTEFPSLKGPGVFQLDLALSRTFPLREKQTIQLRAEAFNLPNHVNPAIPGQNTATATANALNSGNFGQSTSDVSGTSGLSTGDYRIVQFVLKYFF